MWFNGKPIICSSPVIFNIFKVIHYSECFNYFMSRLNLCVWVLKTWYDKKDKTASTFYVLNGPKPLSLTLCRGKEGLIWRQRKSLGALWESWFCGFLSILVSFRKYTYSYYIFLLLATLSSTDLKELPCIICLLCFISMKKKTMNPDDLCSHI